MTCVPALLGSNELRFLSSKHLTLVLVQGCFHLIKLLFAISFVWKVIFCLTALYVALLLWWLLLLFTFSALFQVLVKKNKRE